MGWQRQTRSALPLPGRASRKGRRKSNWSPSTRRSPGAARRRRPTRNRQPGKHQPRTNNPPPRKKTPRRRRRSRRPSCRTFPSNRDPLHRRLRHSTLLRFVRSGDLRQLGGGSRLRSCCRRTTRCVPEFRSKVLLKRLESGRKRFERTPPAPRTLGRRILSVPLREVMERAARSAGDLPSCVPCNRRRRRGKLRMPRPKTKCHDPREDRGTCEEEK